MGRAKLEERSVPEARVLINGTRLPPLVENTVQVIEVDQSLSLIDMAKVQLANGGGGVSELDLFDFGNEIEIQLGFIGKIKSVFKGELISVEPCFPQSGNASVVVRAYDKLHRYRRGRHQRTFLNQKVSDVVTALASEEGLKPDVEDTKITHEYLLQNNLTNIEFIKELARRYYYEVFVKFDTLHFRRPKYDKGKALTLEWNQNLKSFHVRKSSANVATKVEARYWDMEKKKHVVEAHGRLHGKLGADIAKETKKAFGQGTVQISARTNTVPGEAKNLAFAVYNEQALLSTRGHGTAYGDPELEPGQVIELEGLSKAWDGKYYVTACTHMYDVFGGGYTTEFRVHATGA
jgi:phage protein D